MSKREAKAVIEFVSELVRGARAMRGWGLRSVAKASGISIATLSRIERGGVPDALTFVRLVGWLHKETQGQHTVSLMEKGGGE